MSPRKFRWSKVYESAEEELVEFLASRQIKAERHEIPEMEQREIQTATDAVSIWGIDGSASIKAGDKTFSMQAGDTLKVPAGVACTITAGFSGFMWYQS